MPLCGGCKWQEIDYSEQLARKQKRVVELFSTLSSETIFHEILGAANPWRYRNKMEFSFSQNRAGDHFLGLMIAKSRGRVLNLNECHLASSWFIETLKNVRSWWIESGLKAYHRYANTGSLRSLTLREGVRTQDKMVILTVSGHPDFSLSRAHLESFVQASGAASIFLCVQQIMTGAPTQFFEMHLAGRDHIQEQLEIHGRSYMFKISPRSFFQPNTRQAEQLYRRALEMAGAKKRELMLDLYCGTATLGIVFAEYAKRVVGIELSPEAILDAECNVKMNKADNVELHCGDVAKILKQEKIEKPDLVIVDPPRCGLMEEALAHILALAPQEILYISCNPEAQAKNVKAFVAQGYALCEIQPIDQFPHTPHIENIALLRKR